MLHVSIILTLQDPNDPHNNFLTIIPLYQPYVYVFFFLGIHHKHDILASNQ